MGMSKNNHLSKYISIVKPSQIEIKREDIYYREKYQEIIEFLKLLLTESTDLEIYNYFQPKGNLLINIHPGTDIIDYLKLICSNFYITYIQLKESNIMQFPADFHDNFYAILNNLDKLTSKENGSDESDDKEDLQGEKSTKNRKKLLVIDQKNAYKDLFTNNGLLEQFLKYYKEEENLTKLLENNLLIAWINYDYEEIIECGDEVYEVFDLLITVPLINKVERQQILSEFMENHPEISFNRESIVESTENWEVKEINQVLKIAILKHYLKSELNTKSNEITDIVLQIIEDGEYIPFSRKKALLNVNKRQKKLLKEGTTNENSSSSSNYGNQESNSEEKSDTTIKKLLEDIKQMNYSEFMLHQLYKNAASDNYNELVIIIDKLDKGEPLEENDRKILAKYPFILNESKPSRAQIYLENAKKRIDLIKKTFGK